MSVWINIQTVRNRTGQLGRTLGIVVKAREVRARHLTTHHDQLRVSSPIDDNYCVNAPVYARLLTRSKETVNVNQLLGTLTKNTIETQTQETLSVNSHVPLAHSLKGQSQKKDVSPVV